MMTFESMGPCSCAKKTAEDCLFRDSPEAAIDDEKNGDEEGGHLAGVN